MPLESSTACVALTGASGFIGSALTERLLELDAQVHCLLLPDDPATHLQQVRGRIQIHRADLDTAGLPEELRVGHAH